MAVRAKPIVGLLFWFLVGFFGRHFSFFFFPFVLLFTILIQFN